MRGLKLFLMIFLLLQFSCSFSQQLSINKDSLTYILKQPDIDDMSSSGGSQWFIANDDSSFFKSDTLNFCNLRFACKRACHYIVWHFDSNLTVFEQENLNLCVEPPKSEGRAYALASKVKVKEDKTEKFLTFIFNEKTQIIYKIISFIPFYVQYNSSGIPSKVYKLELLKLKN